MVSRRTAFAGSGGRDAWHEAWPVFRSSLRTSRFARADERRGSGRGFSAWLTIGSKQNTGFTAILDDRRARSLAIRNGVPVLGSLRVIVLAKQRGSVPAAK